MDQFDKDIDLSLKLDDFGEIDDVLEKRLLNRENFNEEVERVSLKFGKRTN